jgi:hypothetical protein
MRGFGERDAKSGPVDVAGSDCIAPAPFWILPSACGGLEVVREPTGAFTVRSTRHITRPIGSIAFMSDYAFAAAATLPTFGHGDNDMR